MRRWGRACQGEGQFVLIVGEAGLGKLACSKHFTAERDTPHTWTEWGFLQLLQNTPPHPITEMGAAARNHFHFGDSSGSVVRFLGSE